MMTKGRVPNWSVKLAELATEVVGQDFVWGETDCVSLVRRALEVMYGEDIVKPYFSGKYKTKTGAIRAFKAIEDVAIIIEQIGGRQIAFTALRDGDILVFEPSVTPYQNLMIRIGSMWIHADEDFEIVTASKIQVSDLSDSTARAFRI